MGKPPPMPLAIAMMSGVTPAHSCAKNLPVRPTPDLDLVEDEQHAALVAQLAQRTQEFRRSHMDAAFALNRLDEQRRGLPA